MILHYFELLQPTWGGTQNKGAMKCAGFKKVDVEMIHIESKLRD